jgi:hypothetical protein
MASRKATKDEREVAHDEAQMRSITTGQVLRERALCPAVILRTRDGGVHIGYLADYSHRDGSELGVAEVVDGRQLWWWGSTGDAQSRELHEVAEDGAARAKISRPCRRPYTLAGVASVMALSPEAEANLMRDRWES